MFLFSKDPEADDERVSWLFKGSYTLMWSQRQFLLVKFREEIFQNLSPTLPWASEDNNSPIISLFSDRKII